MCFERKTAHSFSDTLYLIETKFGSNSEDSTFFQLRTASPSSKPLFIKQIVPSFTLETESVKSNKKKKERKGNREKLQKIEKKKKKPNQTKQNQTKNLAER